MEPKQIDEITQQFRILCEDLSEEEMNWKSNRETWSIGQNLEHLIRVNESYYPIVRKLHTGTYRVPFHGRIGFVVEFFGKTLLKSVQPDRKKKVRTFTIWQPSENTTDLEAFESHQQELKQMLAGCEDLLKKDVVISSPANRNIVYRLQTAFEIIKAHEQRHLEQVREVISRMGTERTSVNSLK